MPSKRSARDEAGSSKAPRFSAKRTTKEGQQAACSSGLSSEQAAALGPNPPPFVFHQHAFAGVHAPAPAAAENVLSEEEEQSYDEFVDMGQREPDEEGRGRWKLSSSRRTLALVPVRQQHKSAQWTRAEDVAVWLRAFLGVEVAILSELTIAKSSGGRKKKGSKKAESYVLEDRRASVGFPLRSVHAVNEDGERMEAVDVFSLLKVAEEYVNSDHFSALFLVDVPLAEEVDKDVCHEVVRTRSDVCLLSTIFHACCVLKIYCPSIIPKFSSPFTVSASMHPHHLGPVCLLSMLSFAMPSPLLSRPDLKRASAGVREGDWRSCMLR